MLAWQLPAGSKLKVLRWFCGHWGGGGGGGGAPAPPGAETWSHFEAIRELGSAEHWPAARMSRVRKGAFGRQPLVLTMSRMMSRESRRLEDLSSLRSRVSSSAHPRTTPPPDPSAIELGTSIVSCPTSQGWRQPWASPDPTASALACSLPVSARSGQGTLPCMWCLTVLYHALGQNKASGLPGTTWKNLE